MQYNKKTIDKLIKFINEHADIDDKDTMKSLVVSEFKLIDDDPVFYNDYFAIRFCYSAKKSFSGTVISLSTLIKYDNKPFIICLVSLGNKNRLFLGNTSLMNKVPHSSQGLKIDKIRGSFNGSSIIKEFDGGLLNEPKYFEELYNFHESFTLEENIERLVQNSQNIKAIKNRFIPTQNEMDNISDSPRRALRFVKSEYYSILNSDLNSRVNKEKKAIIAASFIDNVNIRGRVIEYLITNDDNTQKDLEKAVLSNEPLPKFITKDDLGDYIRDFKDYYSATDIKTKILFLSSCPKGFNIDKLLKFLSLNNTVYLIFIVGIAKDGVITTRLCSVFNKKLLSKTRIIKHWAGRNSRGVSQWDGKVFDELLENKEDEISELEATRFLNDCFADDN